MATNRIRSYVSQSRYRLNVQAAPKAAANQPAISIPHGFVVCPLHLASANAWQQEIYRLAYQRAQAAAQIPRHHRRLFSVWN
jgi:hypothetical protein